MHSNHHLAAKAHRVAISLTDRPEALCVQNHKQTTKSGDTSLSVSVWHSFGSSSGPVSHGGAEHKHSPYPERVPPAKHTRGVVREQVRSDIFTMHKDLL